MVKSELEKAKEIKYDKDGNKLVYVGNNLWLREDCLPTELDIKTYYARFSKPKFYAVSIISEILLPIILMIVICFCCKRAKISYFLSFKNCLVFTLIGLVGYFFVRVRDFLIFLIKLYQRFAPMSVRERCVFTPTCSDYAIISLKKYGIIVGGIKAIKRLKRCKNTNGGIDLP